MESEDLPLSEPKGAARHIIRAVHQSGNSLPAVAMALEAVARARGIKRTSRQTGLTRATVQRLGRSDPRLSTVLHLLEAAGLQFSVTRRP